MITIFLLVLLLAVLIPFTKSKTQITEKLSS